MRMRGFIQIKGKHFLINEFDRQIDFYQRNGIWRIYLYSFERFYGDDELNESKHLHENSFYEVNLEMENKWTQGNV